MNLTYCILLLDVVKRNPLFFYSISCKNNRFLFTTPNICVIRIFVHNINYKTYINYYIQFYMPKCIEFILQNIYSVIVEYRYYIVELTVEY